MKANIAQSIPKYPEFHGSFKGIQPPSLNVALCEREIAAFIVVFWPCEIWLLPSCAALRRGLLLYGSSPIFQ